MQTTIRRAIADEADALASLVNQAYEVERFFVEGDRTSRADVLERMLTGEFLVAVQDDARLVGCVHVEVDGDRGAFGMLAVDPGAQRQGWGRQLVEAAEDHARAAGCRTMEIRVVNLRDDLLPRYRRLGYVDVGEERYVHRPTTRPVHFIVMRKALAP
jgi:GNAT superfamily N-acetyltransferase